MRLRAYTVGRSRVTLRFGDITESKAEVLVSSDDYMHWTAEQVQEFLLKKKYLDSVSGAHYDPHSIMLEFFPPEWTVNGVGTEPNDVFSDLDKQLAAKLYPRG